MAWLVLSVCLYAANNMLWKVFVKGEHPLHIISRRAIFTTVLAFSASWATQTDLLEFVRHPYSVYVVLASFFGAAGLVMMVTFLKEGSLVQMAFYSLMGTGIAASYTFLFHEATITWRTIVGSALIVVGYLIFCFHEHSKMEKAKMLIRQHLLLIGMTLAFSISLLIQWESLKIFPSLAIISTQETVVLAVTSVTALFFRSATPTPNSKQTTLRMALMAGVIFAGIFAGTIGLKTADPFLASLTGFAVPVLTAVSGGVVFREKLTPAHGISLVLMIAGGIFLI